MGILDFLQQPDAQLGIGLLAAGGPTTDPNQTGFGQRLAGAMNSVTANQQIALRAKLMQSQIDENAAQNLLRQQQMVDAQRKQAVLAEWAAGGGAGGKGLDFSPERLAQLKINGTDMTDVAKLAQANWVENKQTGLMFNSNDPNDPNKPGGSTVWMRTPDGKVISQDMRSGEVSAAPSSLNTFGGFEQEKAKTTPGKGAIGPDQRMYPTTAAQDMGLVPMPWERAAAVRGGGPTNASERGMAASVAEPNPDPVQAAQRERASILRELPNVQDPKSQAAMRYQIADLDKVIASGGAGAQTATPSALVPSGGKAGGMDFSPAEKADQAAAEAAKVAQAKGEVVLKQDKQKALDSGNDALRTIDKALNHPGLETGTGLSSKVNPKNYIPGTDAFNFGVVRDQLKGQAFLQAFASLKGGGQITEVEGTKAENAMARLNNAQSTKEYKDSLQDLRDVVDRGLRRTRGENVPDVPLASNDGSKAPGKVIDDLPKTAAVGARLRDTTTGKILKFDGLKWKDE